jgi:thiamine-phosphate pyrophosphorylase
MTSQARPAFRGLYLISDEPMVEAGGFPDFLEQCLAMGLSVAQLRAKRMDRGEMLEIARECRARTRRSGALFIVNDDIQLAIDADADGVHIGQKDMSPALARQMLGPRLHIGLSVGDIEQVRKANREPVDSVGFGPVFETKTKEDADAATGLESLRQAARESVHPVTAIGGINTANAPDVLEAGAQAIAVITAISRAENPMETTKDFLQICGQYRPKQA